MHIGNCWMANAPGAFPGLTAASIQPFEKNGSANSAIRESKPNKHLIPILWHLSRLWFDLTPLVAEHFYPISPDTLSPSIHASIRSICDLIWGKKPQLHFSKLRLPQAQHDLTNGVQIEERHASPLVNNFFFFCLCIVNT